jgi:membrane fusion protein (multidrug efflux system)
MTTAAETPPHPAPQAAAPAPAPQPKPLLRRLLLPAALLALAAVAAPYALHWANQRASHSMTDDAFVEAHIVNLAPEMVSGRIVRFQVQENDRVKQGQLLAEIDPTHYQDQVDVARSKLDSARAELRRQEASVARLRKEVPLQIEVAKRTLAAARADESRADGSLDLTVDEVEKSIDQARAALKSAQASELLARQEYDRYRQLYREEAVPLRKYQQVTQTRDSAQEDVKKAEAGLAKAVAERKRIDVARQTVDAARATTQKAVKGVDLSELGHDQLREAELQTVVKKESVEDARRNLQVAETQLRFTRIHAPFPGVVVKRYRNLGDFASPGVAVLSMYNPDLLYVTANLEETRLRGVAPGNAVELRVDAFSEPFRGRVVWINKSTGAQFALMPRNVVAGEFTKVVQRVPVRIWIDQDDRWPRLRAGLSVSVSIAHGEGDAAWAEQASRELAELEERYNRALAPEGRK